MSVKSSSPELEEDALLFPIGAGGGALFIDGAIDDEEAGEEDGLLLLVLVLPTDDLRRELMPELDLEDIPPNNAAAIFSFSVSSLGAAANVLP
jgi:hypothetical protein